MAYTASPKTHCDKCATEICAEPRQQKGSNGKYYTRRYCPKCRREYKAKWGETEGNPRRRKKYSPEHEKNQQLKIKYGITLAEYNDMLKQQGGLCFICQTPGSDLKKGLAVDHCHSTGQVRKLLCGRCNTALGSIKENFDVALSMAKYIQDYNGVV